MLACIQIPFTWFADVRLGKKNCDTFWEDKAKVPLGLKHLFERRTFIVNDQTEIIKTPLHFDIFDKYPFQLQYNIN